MQESKPPRRKRQILRILLALFLLRAAWIGYKYLGPNPAIVVSKKTTFITEPLGQDGLPDYFEYIRLRQSLGVTPENNAVVLLAQVVGPRRLSGKNLAYYNDELGLKAPFTYGERFVPFPEDLKQIILQTGSRPWQDNSSPELVRWLKDNQEALDVAVEAAKRQNYYSPMFGEQIATGSNPTLLSIMLLMESDTRDLANALCVRAMWHLGDNHHKEAIADILAAAKLSRLLAEDTFLICSSPGFQCDILAMQAMQTVLASAQLTAQEARTVSTQLQSISDWAAVTTSLNPYNRLMILDVVLNMERYGVGSLDLTTEDSWSWMDFISVDYNVALNDINGWFDRLDEAAVSSDRRSRDEFLDEISDDVTTLSLRAMKNKEEKTHRLSLQKRSQVISDILVCQLLPDIGVIINLQDRANTQLELTRLAAALAVYRAEQGAYPEQLADLVPGVLPKLPVDLYSGKSFLYERKDDGGYLLYSVFENEIDDGGDSMSGDVIDGQWVDEQPEDFSYAESDLVIRVPMPALKFPEPPSKEDFGYGFDGEYGGGYVE